LPIKNANDHAAGDVRYGTLVAVLKEMRRPTAAIGRYGGEEFVILFPDMERPAAGRVTPRIRRGLTERFSEQRLSAGSSRSSTAVAEIDRHLGPAEALEHAPTSCLRGQGHREEALHH